MALLLVALTVQVVADAGPLIPLDESVRDGMRDLAATSGLTWLDGPTHALADLGGPLPGGLALLAAYAYAWRRTAPKEQSGEAGRVAARAVRIRLAAVAAASVALVSALVVTGKIVIARPGTKGLAIGNDDWGFFPSGHTATSAVCFGTAALFLGCVLGPRVRRRVYAGTFLLCGLIGLSLLWCDYHWFGDVLGSWSLVGIVLRTAARSMPEPPGSAECA